MRIEQEKVFETREHRQHLGNGSYIITIVIIPKSSSGSARNIHSVLYGNMAVWLAPDVWVEGWSVKLKEELPKLVLFSSSHFQTFSSEHHCMDSSIGTQE